MADNLALRRASTELLQNEAAGLRSVIAMCRADLRAADLDALVERARTSGGLASVLCMVEVGRFDRARLASRDVRQARACLAEPNWARHRDLLLRIFRPRTLECVIDTMLRVMEHADTPTQELHGLAIVLHVNEVRPSETERLYRRALAAEPDDADLLGDLALLLYHLGRASEARTFYERALAVDPDHPAILGNYALLLDGAGETALAAELYEHALTIDPADTINLCNLADIEHRRGNLDVAQLLYEAALALDPDSPHISCNYGHFLESARDALDEAERHYARALASDPTDEQTIVNWAWLLEFRRGDRTRAEALRDRLR